MQEFQSLSTLPPGALRAGSTSSHVAAVGGSHQIPSAGPLLATQQVLKAYEKKDQEDRKTIGMIEGAGSIVMLPLMLDMVTALLSKILTIGGIGGDKWKSRVDGSLRPWTRAARDTELRDWKNLGNRVDAKRAEFQKRGGTPTKNGNLEARVKALDAADAFNPNKRAEWKPSALGDAFEKQMNKATGFSPFKWVDNKFRGFANWRHRRLFDAAQDQLKGIQQIIDNVPDKQELNLVSKGLNRLGQNIQPKDYHIDYSPLKDSVTKLNAALSARDAKAAESALHEMIEINRKIMRDTPGAHNHALNFKSLRQLLRHGATNMTGSEGWGAIGKEGGSAIGKAMRALPKSFGKASILHVAFGAGAVLMTAAKFMDGGRENRLEGHLIKDFAADIYGVRPDQVTKEMLTGKDAHPLVNEVAKGVKKAKGGRGIHNGLHAGFEIANVATLKGLGAGGMLLLPWYGAPGMPGIEQATRSMLIGEQSTLLAYQALKNNPQLSDEEKVNCTRVLIASIPGFAKNHGIDNRQIDVMANELVGQKLTGMQILQTVANPDKIIPMANAAQQKLEAKAAEAKAAEPKASETAAKAPETMLAAGKPAGKVMASEASHEGRVQAVQKAHGV